LLLETTGVAVSPSVSPVLQTLLGFLCSNSEELLTQVIVKSHLQRSNDHKITQLRH